VFKNQGTADVFAGRYLKAARKVCPPDLLATAKRKLDALNAAEDLNDLRVPPGNRLEAMHGDREGPVLNPAQRSIPGLLRLDGTGRDGG
jgi:proteic killer suppression protein